MTKMIPPVPTSAVMMPTPKQKIGFSIESIVGNDAAPSTNTTQTSLEHHLNQNTLKNDLNQQQQQQQQQHQTQTRHDIQDIINRLHNTANNLIINNNNNNNNNLNNNNNNLSNLIGTYSPPPAALLHLQQNQQHQTRLSPEVPLLHLKRERSPVPLSPPISRTSTTTPLANKQHQPHQLSPPSSPQSQHHQSNPIQQSASSSPNSLLHHTHQQQHQQQQFNMIQKGPIIVPGMPAGLVRPFPVGPNNNQVPPPPPSQPDIKALPPYISSPEMIPPQHPHHNPHLLAAAQFQMAAALQAGHVLGPAAAAAAAAAGLQPHSPFLQNHHGGMPRDSYPLYPWLLSRHGRIFPHRFPGNFLLQPFRKPKRIRTAFSPSQLLKLEHAFESNQYVVGAERKALAQSLNLSETQVKVWFQNRRTKHKRMQQEDEKGNGGSGHGGDRHNISCDEDDDELIDMEMDDCPSDDELDASH